VRGLADNSNDQAIKAINPVWGGRLYPLFLGRPVSMEASPVGVTYSRRRYLIPWAVGAVRAFWETASNKKDVVRQFGVRFQMKSRYRGPQLLLLS
jgi:hypothetical protein